MIQKEPFDPGRLDALAKITSARLLYVASCAVSAAALGSKQFGFPQFFYTLFKMCCLFQTSSAAILLVMKDFDQLVKEADCVRDFTAPICIQMYRWVHSSHGTQRQETDTLPGAGWLLHRSVSQHWETVTVLKSPKLTEP